MADTVASSSSSSSSTATAVRSWRTSFLTLRDETLTTPPSVPHLVQSLIFSHPHSFLISAAPDLPPYEVTSDLLFLVELVANASQSQHDLTFTFSHTCHLIHDACHCFSLEINSSSWSLILDSFGKMMDYFVGKAGFIAGSSNAALVKPAMECLETLRYLISVHPRRSSVSDNITLLNFLLHISSRSHTQLISFCRSNRNQSSISEVCKTSSRYSSLWEVQTTVFTMLGDSFSRAGSFFPVEVWQSTMEVLRKMIDILASKNLIVEDSIMSRFYASLLHCLHLVLVDPKCSISEHVSGLVAAVKLFFMYGLSSRAYQLSCPPINQRSKAVGFPSHKLNPKEPKRTEKTPYRPPHLRKKNINMNWTRALNGQNLSDHESCTFEITSSDSDYSDSDGSLQDADSDRSSKVRIAAITCMQDLCQADPKSFTTHWTMLLPTNGVLQPRKYEGTIMTCLLFDPYLKARIASASTLVAMMDGPSSIFLQVAEYKESSKCGSFMALSNSLGHILMQLHAGILYLVQHETNTRLLVLVFKILTLLISCTPYSRMPQELLPEVITSLQARIEEGFPFKNDQAGLLAAAVSCLTAALSISPSPKVNEILLEEVSTGFLEAERSGVLNTLFRYSERQSNPTICFEALQAVRAVCHNHPNLMLDCWGTVSSIVHNLFREAISESSVKTWKEHTGSEVSFIGEKIITAAVKVLDECLRAISGFRGTEDHLDDKLFDTPFTSDCIRTKKVSSAPSYTPGSIGDHEEDQKTWTSGREQWTETIGKHMQLILGHTSAMVRTASVTCFAGITSSVFFSLNKEKQDFIISSLIIAATHDDVPSVKAAACRGIGVISSFQQISESAEILDKFIHAVEINTRDPLASVRITASWALANICDSIRNQLVDFQLLKLLIDCALRLTKDGDKIKSNAVRALGNLSRFIEFTSSQTFCLSSKPAEGDSLWLERMVQAFLSCVTTGNVKVQWNVCHALSNLFLNESIQLQDMDWAPSVFSVLLLLLRDSSNFKIRIQAAAALAVPTSAFDYGKNFSDVVQGLEHVMENLGSNRISEPSSFKYRIVLEKQLTSTFLYVLSLASATDHQPLKDFLVKKASFLEEWFRKLISSLEETSAEVQDERNTVGNQKKEMISKALQSLIQVYKSRNHDKIAQNFEKLDINQHTIT